MVGNVNEILSVVDDVVINIDIDDVALSKKSKLKADFAIVVSNCGVVM